MIRRIRLAAALLVGAAATAAPVAAPPAQAASCAGETGVTVVVDYHQLGGGIRQSCDANGGGKAAAELFADNGFSVTYVQSQPGFVCRVSGKPAVDPCVTTPPSDAYWGLFWSDGENGQWVYSTQGVTSLTVPDGGSVAFAWQGTAAKSPPGVGPGTSGPEPPKPSDSVPPSGGPSGGPGSASPSEDSVGPTDQPSPTATESASASPSGSRSPSGSTGLAVATQDAAVSAGGGPGEPGDARVVGDQVTLPMWIFPVVMAALAAAGAVAAVRRRRQANSAP